MDTVSHVLASKLAFSVPEFCRQHDISKALFYCLLRDGRGPVVMKVGGRTLISAEAASSWRKRMESLGRAA
jgi:hypothetical protein